MRKIVLIFLFSYATAANFSQRFPLLYQFLLRKVTQAGSSDKACTMLQQKILENAKKRLPRENPEELEYAIEVGVRQVFACYDGQQKQIITTKDGKKACLGCQGTYKDPNWVNLPAKENTENSLINVIFGYKWRQCQCRREECYLQKHPTIK